MKINGELFRKARESRLLNISELSNQSDIAFKTLVRVERSQPVKYFTLKKIISALGLTIEEAIAKRMVQFDDNDD
ncbi:MAG: hypothetical protein LBV23_01255 [Deltaproteobacteria bacterium]|jgi:transcriptional regulator with XRE-family HTH domain|nr:hypothetical protein [Deltaproteobacteria bacterium]